MGEKPRLIKQWKEKVMCIPSTVWGRLSSPAFCHMFPVHWYSLPLARVHAFAILQLLVEQESTTSHRLKPDCIPQRFQWKDELVNRASSVDVVESSPLRGEIVRSITEKNWVQYGHFSFLGNHFALFSGENMAVIQLKMNRN